MSVVVGVALGRVSVESPTQNSTETAPRQESGPTRPDQVGDMSMTTQLVQPPDVDSHLIACRATGASKTYGAGDTQVRALDEIDISFAGAEFTSIMGPSGSGKSTLMHCLAGLDRPTHGEIWIGSTELSSLDEGALTTLRRDRIGFVFQGFNLIPTMTARENICLPIDLAGGKIDSAWLDQVVHAVGLQDRIGHRPTELSGGQQQRVAVARALVSKPDIVFADEPTGNLDSRTGADILSFLRDAVRRFGQTIVMVTHDPVAASYADRVVFLKDGKIVNEIHDPLPEAVRAAMTELGA